MATELKKDTKISVRGREVINAYGGDVHVVNTDLITPHMLDCMKHFLNEEFGDDFHGLYSIVFRDDGRPRKDGQMTTWMFMPDSQSAICNIKDCIAGAFEDTLYGEHPLSRYTNVRASVWYMMMTGFYHEVHHAASVLVNPDVLENKEEHDNEEKLAEEFAYDSLIKEVKAINLEVSLSDMVDHLVEERWFEEVERIEELAKKLEAEDITDDERKIIEPQVEWMRCQEYMRHTGVAYCSDALLAAKDPKVCIETFKELMAHIDQADPNDPEWNLDTLGVLVSLKEEIETKSEQAQVVENAPAYKMDETDYEADLDDLVDPNYNPSTDPLVPSEVVMPTNNGVVTTPQFGVPAQQVAQQQVVQQPVQQPVQQQVVQQPVQQVQQVNQPGTFQQTFTPHYQTVETQQGQVGGQVNPQAAVKNYGPTGITPERMNVLMPELYFKCFQKIFTECQFTRYNWAAKSKIEEKIFLTPEEQAAVKGMSCILDGKQAWNVPVTDHIIGMFLDKKGELPSYFLTLAAPDGTQLRRKLLPQNPNKCYEGTNNLKPTAKMAQAGWCILWIINADAKEGEKSFTHRMVYDPRPDHERGGLPAFRYEHNPKGGANDWEQVSV